MVTWIIIVMVGITMINTERRNKMNDIMLNISGQDLMNIYNDQSFSEDSNLYTEHHDSHTDMPNYDDTSW